MSGQCGEMREDSGLTRRDFLTKGVRSRVVALLGGGRVVGAGATAEEGERFDAAANFVPGDLRPQTRDDVTTALDRFRARRTVS